MTVILRVIQITYLVSGANTDKSRTTFASNVGFKFRNGPTFLIQANSKLVCECYI